MRKVEISSPAAAATMAALQLTPELMRPPHDGP
jgi:hypothetical protein